MHLHPHGGNAKILHCVVLQIFSKFNFLPAGTVILSLRIYLYILLLFRVQNYINACVPTYLFVYVARTDGNWRCQNNIYLLDRWGRLIEKQACRRGSRHSVKHRSIGGMHTCSTLKQQPKPEKVCVCVCVATEKTIYTWQGEIKLSHAQCWPEWTW